MGVVRCALTLCLLLSGLSKVCESKKKAAKQHSDQADSRRPISVVTDVVPTYTFEYRSPNPKEIRFTSGGTYQAYLEEMSPLGTAMKCDLKMGVYAKDIRIDFIITRGNQRGIFKAKIRQVKDFYFMDIITVKRLNRESTPSYLLTIVAQDAVSKRTLDSTQVNITVKDSNDNRPIFLNRTYLVTISEDIAMHTSIAKVQAVDADVGSNSLIYYSLRERTNAFAIHPRTGVVTVTRKLDSTRDKVQRLTIVARDRGLKSKSTKNCKVIVKIQAVNQFPPVISIKSQLSSVDEGVRGVVYGTLEVIDQDKGVNGHIDRVEITSGNIGGTFGITSPTKDSNNFTTTLTIRKPLDREIAPYGYNVTVTAFDAGIPSKNGSFTLRVFANDINDNNPEFENSSYVARVSELSPSHTPVVRVFATDKDSGPNGQVVYAITRGNEQGKFEINSKTGQIYTTGYLDFEDKQSFDLEIAALDGAPPSSRRMSNVGVFVQVLDANDHSPMFVKSSFQKDVYEDLTAGTSVFSVSAKDKDYGSNGKVRYSIANVEPVPFSIDPNTGEIIATTNLDRDQGLPEDIHLRVRASDFGSPMRRESETIVKFRINAMNDNPPILKQFQCNIDLDRNAPPGVILTTIKAVDVDVGETRQQLSYKFTFGNTGNTFRLDPKSGELRTAKTLQRAPKEYTLYIKAFDGIQESPDSHPAILKVHVISGREARKLANHVKTSCIDSPLFAKALETQKKRSIFKPPTTPNKHRRKLRNRHTPVFRSHDPRAYVKEDAALGAVIMQLVATDQDKSFNGLVVYSIVKGDTDSVFYINMYNGQLSIKHHLDRETTGSYTLNISASDCGKKHKTAFTILTVIILDVNDNSPVFEKSLYEVKLSENVTVGQTLAQVSAVDTDKGLNGDVKYELISDFDGKFRIDQLSGNIFVAAKLDYEEKSSYVIQVRAIDGSFENPKEARAEVHLVLIDVNDNAPMIKPSRFNVSIPEDLLQEAVVTTILAFDQDSGPGGEIEYSLLESKNKFKIDSESGVIRLRRRLNHERVSLYNITVRVSDKGSPQLSTDVHIVVNILNVNENRFAPIFEGGKMLRAAVFENLDAGTIVLYVKATDKEKNSWYLKYAIIDGTGVDKFVIDPDTGAIRTTQKLDHEAADHYWLTVQAKDGEIHPLYTNIPVLIDVLDVNDEAPFFSPLMYYPSVAENKPTGTTVVQVTAIDPDSDGSKLVYSITKGNDDNIFTINPRSGVITTLKVLDREREDEHAIVVMATDGGTPPKSASVSFSVKVIDENDHQPLFTESQYIATTLPRKASAPPSQVFQILATDEDIGSNAELHYSIVYGNTLGKLSINRKSGIISCSSDLTDGDTFDLTVNVKDGGRPSKSTNVTVIIDVVAGNPPSSNPPSFWQKSYSASVAENAQIGDFVAGTGADDPDNDQVGFSITGGNVGHKFTIDRLAGFVTIAQKLDREVQSSYTLTITASDGYNSVNANLVVTVLDINDNVPQPERKEYRADVAEDVAVGKLVAIVKANDPDAGVNGEIDYSIIGSSKPKSTSLFKISSITGKILTTKPLDYEDIREHVLIIKAKDRGSPKKSSLFSVVISVIDVNDHKPLFVKSVYESEVDINAKIGFPILKVIASDKDDGLNAKLKYTIIKGNANDSLSVDQNSGLVRVSNKLSSSVKQYVLKVQAADSGKPSLVAQTTVKIKVRGVVKKYSFDRPVYEASIKENSPPGQALVRVVFNGVMPVYEMVPSRTTCWKMFLVQRQSGVIVNKVAFDAETLNRCKFQVRASSIDGQQSTAMVIITVLDENDNAPSFAHDKFIGHVVEGASVGSPVLNSQGIPLAVNAKDIDVTENDKLTYEILELNAKGVFAIHPATGAITTNRVLDYETTSKYSFKVKVTDSGSPKLSTFTDVEVRVTDVNDVPPVFSTSTYHATVYLPTVAKTMVVKVTATDDDSPSLTQLTYSLADDDFEKLFHIDTHKGVITVKNATKIVQGTYRLTVNASDGKFFSRAQVRIRCEVLSRSSLQFRKPNHTASVLEGVTARKELLIPQVIGYPIGETITFSIVNPSELFDINPSTGVVTINKDKTLDREVIDSYEVVIEARDGNVPPEIAQTVLHVMVDDINDNRPVFVGVPYYIVLQLGVRVDSKVGQVVAQDKDIGSNGELRYILKGGDDGRFKVNHKSGDVIVRKSLDDVIVPKLFTLIVEAHDRGRPRFSAQTEVKVKVVDRETPVFDQLSFNKDIEEDVKVGTVITHVKARSPNGAEVLYSITKGDPVNQFTIDFKTGIITVAASLDYESMPDYKLMVRATDAKTSAHAEVVVDIMIIDVNDIAPVFNRSFYLAKTVENTAIGTPILTVQAKDGDSGINKLVSYSLQNASQENKYFTINQTSGVLYVAKNLDYEDRVVHEMIIVASDGGAPVLTGETRVRVVLQDANDNSPVFEKTMYAASILGNAGPGHFVMRVIATDPDYSDVTKLTYAIVSGHGKQHFHIDSKSGVIILSRVVGIERGKVYDLGVTVSDGQHTAKSRVRIIIGDTNSHSPVFTKDVYQVDFHENYPEGTFVTMVSATDLDSGNYARIKYSIDSVDAMRRFRIDDDTGMMYSRLMFDRENSSQAVMAVPVRATDGGGRFGFCIVKVMLLDENDNQPKFEFKRYDSTISRSVVMRTSVLMTSAVDDDAGSNSDLTYLILGHQTPPIFSMAQSTGVIKVVRVPEAKEYNFFVLVKDNGNPQLRNLVPVKIEVLENDVKILQFEKSKYDINVDESASLGEVAESLKLVVPTGTNPVILYSIVRSNSQLNDKKFNVDTSGRLRVAGLLDYETTKRYVMVVEANASSIDQVARTAVVVNIKDVNDNKPTFVSNPYLVSIPENIDIGSKVLRVFAEDLDSGKNGEVVYQLSTSDRKVLQKFDIDRNTGWVTTKGALDRENRESFVFDVLAVDKATKVQLSSKTTVRAAILDVNDSPPKFSKSEFTASVKEDALIGQTVTTITAKDSDLKSDLFYFILSGDPQAKFEIERKTGVIFVHGSLDRESVSSYKLNVSASDGLYTSFSQVKIGVEDANDNAPICRQSMYMVRISEDVKIGSRVLTIVATDTDIGVNAQLNYTVYGQGAGVVTVDRNKGHMTTLVQLDRETRPYYNFMVSASDIGGQSCFTNVTIHLDDVNDNHPAFTQRRYIASVYEDASLKKVLLQVRAVDSDVGINRKVTYSLITDAEKTFEIEAGTGMISLIKPLNREHQENYTLKVKAQDGGVPSLWSTAVVEVQVLNINDVPPEFSRSVYQCNITENARKGTRIVTVQAISKESNKDSISYGMLQGSDSNLFRIHSRTGVIRVVGKLDYEKKTMYTLTVQASDSGPPVLMSTASINIAVTDANDNQPIFSEDKYVSKVDENSVFGTFVLQVFATDKDTGSNSQIRYSIVSGNEEGKFDINEATGIVKVAALIDRETNSEFTLVIRARDQGNPFKQSQAVAKIIVTDVNDNPPTLTQNNLTVQLQENTPLHSTVLHLRPHDKDTPDNGAPYIFTLISGGSSKFALNSRTGLITNTGSVSRSDADYTLRILMADSGHPPQSKEVSVTIKVMESISHPPEVEPLTSYVNLYGSFFNGGVIGRVKGVDKDGDKLTYSLVNAPRRSALRITSEGTVRAKPSLTSGVHKLNVSVTDGRFTVYSRVIVVVSDITDQLQANSITLRLYEMTAGTFVEENFEKCKSFFAGLLRVPSRNVHIWSMQSALNDLDVVVAVKKGREGLFESSYVGKKLNSTQVLFKSQVGVRLESISASQCQPLNCPKHLACSDVYKPENKQIRIMSDKTSYISYEHSRSHTCTCKDKSGVCAAAIRKCATKPCAPGYKCTDFPQGYQCKCVDPTKCDMDTTGCEDKSCIKGSSSNSFSGKSYIRYRLKETFNQPSRSVGLAVKTVKSEGTLVFAAGQYDYSILEIVKGFIQLRFDYGSGAGVVSIDWTRVNDGKWHHVAVERQGNHATLILDHGKHQASGQSPGRMRILNLDDNSIYFGAKVLNSRVKRSSGNGPVVENGFNGCMQNLNLNGKDLPMTGSNAHATGYPSSVSPGCSTSGACRVPNTCPRASKCIETFTGRTCDCLRGHSGPDCKPFITCSEKPCQNAGVCYNEPRGYRCVCPTSYTGYQCEEFIGSCASSPCKNGGTCFPGTSGDYKCKCPIGVSGANCEFDKRPCSTNPCYFNANCTNQGDDFKCACPRGLSGKRCEQGFHCNRMPCLNGGSCDVKDGQSVCVCAKGFTGPDCSVDVNECTSDPCKNKGVCVNTVGSFFCNCSTSTHGGPLCANVLANVTPDNSKWPLSLEAIIGIGVVLAVLILIVLIVVILLRRRARRKRELTSDSDKANRNSVLKVSPPVVGSDLNSPTPPTPPPRIPDEQPPSYEEEDTWRRNETPPSFGGTTKSLNNSESNVEKYHWDYTDIPTDIVQRPLNRERSASYMGVPDDSVYGDDVPRVPERSVSMMSSHSSGLDVPEVPQRPRNYRPSESDDQHLEVPPMPNTRRRPLDSARSTGQCPSSRYSMDSEFSDMTDLEYCKSIGGDSAYPDLFKGRFPRPPRDAYPESVDTFPVDPYHLTKVRDSELGSMTDFSEDDLERVYLGNSRMEACGDSPENTYLHSVNASEDDQEGDPLQPEDPDFHQHLQNEIKEMMDQLEELKMESEL